MKRFVIVACVLAFAAAVRVTPVAADPIVLDQQSMNPRPGTTIGGGSLFDDAQTFTVGISGILRQIDVALAVPMGSPNPFTGDLLFQLRSVENGMPGSSVLAEQLLPGSVIPDGPLFTFDTFFTGLAVPVVAGEQLTIVLGSRHLPADSSNFGWVTDTTEPYAAGALFIQEHDSAGRSSGPWQNISSTDAAFRTFVEPTPEPASILLVSAGAMLLCRSRKRTSRTAMAM
jgi:hypothetical protein